MKQLSELSTYISEFSLNTCPTEVIHAAKICLSDTVGTALGASNDSLQCKLRSEFATQDLISNKNKANNIAIWGTSFYAPLPLAAFFNAMQSHTLEMDDVHIRSKTHIGTVVIPAAWALAEKIDSSGSELLESIICGYESMARIGMGFGVSSHRNKGWHVTGTAGTFGAAAACAKLLKLSPSQIESCFGLAGTQSCGTWAFLADGATNKVLHPGRAASSGLESCLLTLGGMRGASEILSAEDGGIYPMMSDQYNYDAVSQGLGKDFEILKVDKKPYPCCRSTHCAIDASIKIFNKYNFSSKDIKEVNVNTYLVGLKQCGLSSTSKIPTIPSQAKFSTPYVVACALRNGKVGLTDFTVDAISRNNIQELLRKVIINEDSRFTSRYPNHWGCEVEVTLNSGKRIKEEVIDATGSVENPLTKQQLMDKILNCCSEFNAEWIQQILFELSDIENKSRIPNLSNI